MFKWYSYFTTENFSQNLFLSESSRNLIKKIHFLKNISLFTFNIICKFCIQANPFNPGFDKVNDWTLTSQFKIKLWSIRKGTSFVHIP